MKKCFSSAIATLALIGGVVGSGYAQTYDLSADFSATQNPNGAWSYGGSVARGAAFGLGSPVSGSALGALSECWVAAEAVHSWDSRLPSICFAPEDLAWAPNNPAAIIPKNTVFFHPGPNSENAVIRWTAPMSGVYEINTVFIGRDPGSPTSTDVAVLHGSEELFSGYINGWNVALPFSVTRAVAAGETIDLTLGFGANGNYYGDTTGVSATITLISPPASTPNAKIAGGGALAFQGGKANIGLTAKTDATGQVKGNLVFSDKTTGRFIKSSALTALVLDGASDFSLYGKTADDAGSSDFSVTIKNGYVDLRTGNGYHFGPAALSDGNIKILP